MPSNAFDGVTMPQKCVVVGALLSRTLRKELTALRQILLDFRVAASRRRREKEKKCERIGERERKKGEI